jgi:hypothetical protein
MSIGRINESTTFKNNQTIELISKICIYLEIIYFLCIYIIYFILLNKQYY